MENVKTMKHKRIRGFSLMELLAVMAIMAILSTMAITGYFSAVRGMTRRRAVSNLMASLTQARQRACIDGTRTALVCYNVKSDAASSDITTVSPTYVICKALGRVTSYAGGKIGDEFTPLDKIFGVKPPPSQSSSTIYNSFGSRRLYNLSRTGWTDVEVTVESGAYNEDLLSGLTGKPFLPAPTLLWCFTKAQGGVDNADWRIGDLYGIDVSQPGIFPKNVYFGDLGASSSQQINVMFYPDGRAKTASISIIAQDGKKIATINVDATGNVTGGKEINLD
jgi:prepilin-type N-terminal cleavage/methylation domain-containing protein